MNRDALKAALGVVGVVGVVLAVCIGAILGGAIVTAVTR
jgi:hypothetical protein